MRAVEIVRHGVRWIAWVLGLAVVVLASAGFGSARAAGATPERVGAALERVGAAQERVGAAPERVGAALERVGAAPERVGAAPEREGAAPAIPAGSQVLGDLPGSSLITATVILAPRDPPGLAAYAQEVSTPGSSRYHQYLSVAQFRARFAPTPTQAQAVRSALAARGVTAG
ncbi:MAG: protease pro-enzyme activation domain-containing protein, partial [Solirubrobacteraceae bacterium]